MRDVTRGYGGRVEERRSASYENERMVGNKRQKINILRSTDINKDIDLSLSLSLSMDEWIATQHGQPTIHPERQFPKDLQSS